MGPRIETKTKHIYTQFVLLNKHKLPLLTAQEVICFLQWIYSYSTVVDTVPHHDRDIQICFLDMHHCNISAATAATKGFSTTAAVFQYLVSLDVADEPDQAKRTRRRRHGRSLHGRQREEDDELRKVLQHVLQGVKGRVRVRVRDKVGFGRGLGLG